MEGKLSANEAKDQHVTATIPEGNDDVSVVIHLGETEPKNEQDAMSLTTMEKVGENSKWNNEEEEVDSDEKYKSFRNWK